MALFKVAAKRWPGGVVPFTIDPLLQNNANANTAIAAAMTMWSSVGGGGVIVFVPYAPFVHQNWIRFGWSTYVQPSFCSSPVGIQGGEQHIRCHIGTVNTVTAGLIAHEIGHALGLQHEHQRPDRDDFVIFNPFFAYYVAGRSPVDFKKLLPPYNAPHGKYECASIMHYSPLAVLGFSFLAGKTTACNTAMSSNVLSSGDQAVITDIY